jgi:hypothetical protein
MQNDVAFHSAWFLGLLVRLTAPTALDCCVNEKAQAPFLGRQHLSKVAFTPAHEPRSSLPAKVARIKVHDLEHHAGFDYCLCPSHRYPGTRSRWLTSDVPCKHAS